MKIGIIRRDEQSERCAGYGCLPAARNRIEAFEEYYSVMAD